MNPRFVLTRRMLTLLIGCSILIPVGYGMVLALVTKKIPEPPLDARIRLGVMWTGKNTDDPQRLVPCILIRNPTEEAWKNLSIGLNKQFYAGEPKGLAAGQTISLPLEAFVARNGSVKYPPDRSVQKVTVFAQIPNGARAVSEFVIPESKPMTELPQETWISPWSNPGASEPK